MEKKPKIWLKLYKINKNKAEFLGQHSIAHWANLRSICSLKILLKFDTFLQDAKKSQTLPTFNVRRIWCQNSTILTALTAVLVAKLKIWTFKFKVFSCIKYSQNKQKLILWRRPSAGFTINKTRISWIFEAIKIFVTKKWTVFLFVCKVTITFGLLFTTIILISHIWPPLLTLGKKEMTIVCAA